MALNQIETTDKYALPLERLFSTEGMHKILDCLLSDYELEQKIDDISKFTKLERPKSRQMSFNPSEREFSD